MSQTKKASVLVYSLIIMTVLTFIAISMTTTSNKDMQSSFVVDRSNQAFNTAESGMEIMMNKYNETEKTKELKELADSSNCNDGEITLDESKVGKGVSVLSFFEIDEDNNKEKKLACNDKLADVDEIKSIGKYGNMARAIKMKVGTKINSYSCTGDKPNASQTACADAENGLTADKGWHETSDGCNTDVQCAYKNNAGSHTCTGSDPANATMCSGDNSGLTANTAKKVVGNTAAQCTSTKCEFYCKSGYTYSGGQCVSSGGGGGKSCTLPWGGTIADGSKVTAYSADSVPCGSTCNSQERTCNNGVLSGSEFFIYLNCSPNECKPEMQVTGTTLVSDHDLDFNYPARSNGYCKVPGEWDYKSNYFVIWNRGGGTMNVNVSTSTSWISLNIDGQERIKGQRNISYSFSNESLVIEVNTDACRSVGKYSGNISVTSSNAISGSPQTVSVTSNVYPADGCEFCGQ